MSGIRDDRTASTPFGFGQLHPQPGARKDARTLTKREQQDRGEEERLLGGSSGSDPKAVPIFPGASIRRAKVGANFGFKPRDTLDRDPTRPAYSRASNHLHSVARARNVSHEGATERPRKKLRLERSPPPTANVIEIDDDDPPVQSVSSQKASPRPRRIRSPSSSDNGTGTQRTTSKLSEFWGVEAVVKPPTALTRHKPTRSARTCEISDKDEAFTREAREERVRSQHVSYEGISHARGAPSKRQYMTAVEVPVIKSNKRVGEGDLYELPNKPVPIDGQSRSNTSRESPDELQGGRTVNDVWRQAEARHSISRSSPNDIRPTDFSSPSGKRASNGRQRPDTRKKPQSWSTFSIRLIRYDDQTLDDDSLKLLLDENSGHFFVKTQDGQRTRHFDVNRINSIIWSDDPGNKKMRLRYPGSQTTTNNNVDIEFSNDDDHHVFQATISQPSHIRVTRKPKGWLDNAFARPVLEDKSPMVATKRQNVKDFAEYELLSPQSPKPKRQKLSDSLQNGNEPVERDRLDQRKALAAPNRGSISRLDGSRDILTHAHPSPDKKNRGVEIPVKTYKDPNRSTRQTRSQTKPQNYVLDSDDDAPISVAPTKIRGGKWAKPLVYPKTGKKKAEVEAQDLDRLDDHEFLNDNLIGFYIRFLEYHLERTSPELAKRIYFFNSYFYASLTNKPRGMRGGINYQAVAKWTRSVDLFSYDYVVVPINESAHWYIAIICNLPNLVRLISEPESVEITQRGDDTPKESQDDVREIPPSSISASEDREAMGDNPVDASLENGKDDRLRESFSLMTLQDSARAPSPSHSPPESPAAQEQPASDKDDWPDEEENQKHQSPLNWKGLKNVATRNETSDEQNQERDQTVSKSSNLKPAGKKKGKKPRPPVQKLDPRQPVIITFDSLGCSRPHTVRVLKDYLEEEAESKRSLAIDSSKFIKGMTAKDIPLQPNYSDCGLYLLAYLEKFIRDPDEFATKLLRKEMKREIDWPTMRSGVFRRRLRQFLHDLYEEQYGEKSKDSGSPHLVDSKPLHILLLEDEPAIVDHKSPSPQLGKPSSLEPKSRSETPKKVEKKSHEAVRTPVRSSPRFNLGDQKKQSDASPARNGNSPKKVEKEVPETVEIIDSQNPVLSSPRFSPSSSKKQPTASPIAKGSRPGSVRSSDKDVMLFDDLEGIVRVPSFEEEQQRSSQDTGPFVPETPPREIQPPKKAATPRNPFAAMQRHQRVKLDRSPEIEEIED